MNQKQYNNLVNKTARGIFLDAMMPAAKDMALFVIKGAKKIVPPIISTNLGEGNQLLAMTL